MTTVLILLLTSAVLGMVTGLFYRVWAMGCLSLLIALGSAIALQLSSFRFAEGLAVSVGCLVISQIAYLMASYYSLSHAELMQDEIDDGPGGRGEQDVRDENQ